jgi:hypothetical protein
MLHVPNTERFVLKDSIGFCTSLPNQKYWLWKTEGQRLHIKSPPIARFNIAIAFEPGERSGEEVFGSRVRQIGKRPEHIIEGEMHQTVSADDRISPRNRVTDYIELAERHSWAFKNGVRTDQFIHDVRTCVFKRRQINVPHPIEVTAGGVKEFFDAKLPQDPWKSFNKEAGLFKC